MRIPFFGKKKLVLPVDLIVTIEERQRHTPDYAELEQHKRHLVFIYDDMMTGHRSHDVLDNRRPMYKEAYTKEAMCMYMMTDGKRKFPIAGVPPSDMRGRTFRNGTQPRATIKGEVYAVTTEQLHFVDKCMENTIKYERRRTQLELAFYSVTEHDVGKGIETRLSTLLLEERRAYMYHAKFEYWNIHPTPSQDHRLLKHRMHNQVYRPNYSFTRNDW